MNLHQRVFAAIVKRWHCDKDSITYFAQHSWHSFEEWLNWEAALGCRDDGLQGIWPKAPYSYKNPDRTLPDVIRFKNTRQLSDLMIDEDGQRVVVEVALVHGASGADRSKLKNDIEKLNHAVACPTEAVEILPLLIVASFYHEDNPQEDHRYLPKWFKDWPNEAKSFGDLISPGCEVSLGNRGLFEASAWKIL
jgi:hypothetical protein